MSNAILPLPQGLTWDIKKTPNWGTIIQTATSGREVRVTNRLNPIWEWELSWEWLPDYTPPAYLDQTPPSAPALSSVATNPLPAATYFCVITYVYPEGETLSSLESTLAITAGNCLSVASPSNPGGGALGWNCYIGLWTGGEVLQNQGVLPFGSPFVEYNIGLVSNLNTPNHVDGSEVGALANVVPPAQAPTVILTLEQVDTTWQTLLGFYNARQGSFDSFLYSDPTDGYVFNQIGVGDGSTKTFQLVRSFGGFSEVIQNPLGPLTIYFNGAQQNTGYSVSSTGLVTFVTAPTAGVIITAFCSFFFRCRFSDDSIDGNNWLYNLFELKSLKLTSVKL